MRILQLFILLCMFGTTVFAQKPNCTINVTSLDSMSGTVYMQNLVNNKIDTVTLNAGKCNNKLSLLEPTPIVIADAQRHYQIFIAEPNSNITLDFYKTNMGLAKVEGSKAHNIFKELIQSQEPYQQAAQQMQQMASKPGINKDSMSAILNVINNELRKNFLNFLNKNSTSEVASFVLHSSIANDKNLNILVADSMASILKGKAKTCHFGKEVEKMLRKQRAVNVGYMAPDFTLADSTGLKKYSLSQFRGKYVLLDFWASWCGPCKAEIPFLKDAYARFKNKGFEIVSVSLDSKDDAWKYALRQFKMPWIHISEGKGFSSTVNDLYHVPSIPKTLLLDKTGKIIATDLRGKALDLKLEELLGE